MKRYVALLMSLILAFTLTACGVSRVPTNEQQQEETNNIPQQAEEESPNAGDNSTLDGQANSEGKILIAFFSRSGNTEQLAEQISKQTNGTLFEIIPEEPYPDDYDATVERFRKERDEDARPAIASSVEDMSSYDTIFVGFPIWGGDMPHVVRTFLEEYDLSGKTVVPFCTHGGSGFAASTATLASLCPDASVLDGFEISGSRVENCADGVSDWLNRIGIIG